MADDASRTLLHTLLASPVYVMPLFISLVVSCWRKAERLSLSPERTCHDPPPLEEASLVDCSMDVSETGGDFTEAIDDSDKVVQDQNVSLDDNYCRDSRRGCILI